MSLRFTELTTGLTGLLFAVSVAGCGGSSVPDEETAAESKKRSAKTSSADKSEDQPKQPAVLAMVDRLPHDKIWFPDPLSIVSESTGIEAPKPGPATPGPAKPDEPGPSTGGAVDWDAIAAASELDAEVQSVRAYFTENLATFQTYKTSYLEVAPNAATLIAVSEVAARAKNDVAWKTNARAIRVLAESMLAEDLRNNPKSYNQVKEPFDKIVAILDGKPPEGLDAGAEIAYEDLAVYMTDFMKRLEKSEQRMKTLAGGEANFTKNKDAVKREAAVIGILAKMIQQEGFGYADDEEFLGYANPVVEASQKMIKAADSGDYSVFEIEMSTVSKNCTTCHMGYR